MDASVCKPFAVVGYLGYWQLFYLFFCYCNADKVNTFECRVVLFSVGELSYQFVEALIMDIQVMCYKCVL